MIEKGFLKGGSRTEEKWKKVVLGEPYKDALTHFREKIFNRPDFDPSSLLQFSLFMAKALINVLKECERKLGSVGQQAVIDGLIKTGYDMGKQITADVQIPTDIKDIELMSFLTTIINTQSWSSIENPEILDENTCAFDILWCPLEDIYKAFDCRIQRYLVEGIIQAFRDSKLLKNDYQIHFECSIPSGAKTCRFIIRRKLTGENDKWNEYSEKLAKKALEISKKENV
jgi:hypothetical protein